MLLARYRCLALALGDGVVDDGKGDDDDDEIVEIGGHRSLTDRDIVLSPDKGDHLAEKGDRLSGVGDVLEDRRRDGNAKGAAERGSHLEDPGADPRAALRSVARAESVEAVAKSPSPAPKSE